MGPGMDAFAVGQVGKPPAAGSVEPERLSSRTYTQSRPVFVFLLPGASTGIGVSSACSLDGAIV
ncbi:hypothetical protein WK58_07895 [Burkholderia ubonensis]|nr:hypothetical protein WK58_07895 [Burkholderia ubonensis]